METFNLCITYLQFKRHLIHARGTLDITSRNKLFSFSQWQFAYLRFWDWRFLFLIMLAHLYFSGCNYTKSAYGYSLVIWFKLVTRRSTSFLSSYHIKLSVKDKYPVPEGSKPLHGRGGSSGKCIEPLWRRENSAHCTRRNVTPTFRGSSFTIQAKSMIIAVNHSPNRWLQWWTIQPESGPWAHAYQQVQHEYQNQIDRLHMIPSSQFHQNKLCNGQTVTYNCVQPHTQ